jgi:hypothetical protein
MREKILDWLNRFLVFDVFVVFFGFAWFVLGLVGRSMGNSKIFDVWYQLWIPVFNPAIGILFLGAFASWGISKLKQKSS